MNNFEEDKNLYKAFLKGDNSSFENLISKYKSNLLYFILGYVKSLEVAEDIFQEIALYIFANKDLYNFKYSFKTYLYMLAKSRCLNYLKSQKIRQNYIENFDVADEEKMLEDIVIENEDLSSIKEVLNKLKPDYRQAIYLSVIEDLPYKDIAKIMDKNVYQVKNLVHRAKLKLRTMLVDENIVEIEGNKFVKVLIIIILTVLVASGLGYATYNFISQKEIIPNGKIFGIEFSDKYKDYVENYDEIVEKEEVKPYDNTEIKLISSMAGEGFISIEFEVDLTKEDREYLRLDKSVMTEKDWENSAKRVTGIREDEIEKKIEEQKALAGINTVKIIPNANKVERILL